MLRDTEIEPYEQYEAFLRTSVERYRYLDAYEQAREAMSDLTRERDDWKRIAERWRENSESVQETYDCAITKLARAEDRIEKLERKLAKAKRVNARDAAP